MNTQTGHESGKRQIERAVWYLPRMTKALTVLVERKVKHPLYQKYVRRSVRLHAHDEK